MLLSLPGKALLPLVASFAFLFSGVVHADLAYQNPVAELKAIVDAPRSPRLLIGPHKKTLLQVTRPGLPSITDVAQPELKLAGLRINPLMRAASRFDFGVALTLQNIDSGQQRRVSGLPAGARIADALWSPDERSVAFSVWGKGGVELWLLDVASAKAHRLLESPLNATTDRGFVWVGATGKLLVKTLVAGQEAAPKASVIPAGPNVQESIGGKVSQSRTYPDLLKTPADDAMLDWQLLSQLRVVSLDGTSKALGKPGHFVGAVASPDGNYVLSTELHRPYSRLVQFDRFPRRIEVRDMSGKPVYTVIDRPLLERMPSGNDAVYAGPREISWRSDAPATLFWAEALDGGDPARDVKDRDALFLLPAPFTQSPKRLQTLTTRFADIVWGRNDLALVSEFWWKTRDLKVWRVRPGSPEAAAELLQQRKSEDVYSDPGTPATTNNRWGEPVLLTSRDGQSIYLAGDGASPEGKRPFLDRYALDTRKTTRLWRSEAPWFEEPVSVLDEEARSMLYWRESQDTPPNLYRRELARPDSVTALTHIQNPTPQFKGVQKQLLRYRRADGVDLTATLYLPAGYDAKRDGPLPMLMWAYPQEFKSAAAAGQLNESPYRFNFISYWGPQPFLARGFAVLDNPAMPIVGEGTQEPNDSYLAQLKMNAEAAVKEVTRLGVADPERIAVGGHSYGSFMTANLLAHTRLFRAGIARSGAFNRTLTPFGFQSEDRNFWEAKAVYQAMSPFNYADQIKDALLMIHGEMDNNPGTFPIQSERLYQALQGLGGTSRLVMLPNESHGYRARESILHMLWEEDRWLDTYVRKASPRDAASR